MLVSDDSPDVPLKTSDVYLESLLREASRKRGLTTDAVIDELLREAWRDAAKWEPEIRLLDRISEAFGYFSPRLLSELERNADALEKVSQAFNTYSKQWEAAYHSLNRDNLQRFLADNPDWGEKANKASLDKMSYEARRSPVVNLLIALGNQTRSDAAIMNRMKLLKQKMEDTSKARYRMEVRQAVVLRLRYALTEVAGRVYINKYATGAQRKAYQDLVSCEGFAPAPTRKLPPPGTVTRMFPSYDQELELGKTIVPGWMGIQYKQVNDDVRNRLQLGTGAVSVSNVLPDSPAGSAGLTPGDIIVGPPGAAFAGRDRIREWVMTAPVGIAQTLQILRGDQRLQVSLTPMPEPVRLPDFPAPVRAGITPPALDSLRPYRGALPVAEDGKASYLLFFWATWCTFCKASLPELGAFERERNIPVIAITDEPSQKLDTFFGSRTGYFPGRVMTDELRKTFQTYGVNGLPTFVLVDHGKIKSITVGYGADKGLNIEGWSFR